MFEKLKRIMLRFGALLFFLLTIPAALIGIDDYVTSREVKAWPHVTGTVLRTDKVPAGGRANRQRYRLFLEYAYSVDGKTYRSTRFNRTEERKEVSSAQIVRHMKSHPAGSDIRVYYDPQKPGFSVLDVSGYRAMLGASMFAALLLFLGGYLVHKARRGDRARLQVVERGNFSFRRPKGWKFERHYNKGHDELIYSASGNRTLYVIGSASENHALSSNAQVASNRVNRIEQDSSKYSVHTREEATIADIEGVVLVASFVEKGVNRCSASFCRGYRGFTYEILLESPLKRLDTIQSELVEIVGELQINDPERAAYSLQPKARLPLQSRIYGYRYTPTSPPDWRVWSNLAKDFSEVDLGLFHAAGLVVTVIPVLLPERDPPFESIARGLLAFFGIEPSESALVRTDSGGETPREWRNYELKRVAGDNYYEYRIRVARWDRMAVLITLFGEPDHPMLDSVFGDVVANLHEPAEEVEQPTLASLGRRHRSRQADFLRELATALTEERRPLEARQALRSLLELAPDSADAVNQLLLSYTRVEAFESGYEVLQEYLPTFKDDLRIVAFEPFLLSRMGRGEEALERYRELFARGWRDRDDFYDYVNLLLDQKDFDTAHKLVEERRKEGDGNWLARLVARILRESGDHDAAIAEYRSILEKNPNDTDLMIGLAHELTHAGRFEEAIGVCDELLQRGRTNAGVHYAKGVAESKLEWYPNAKRSFQAALEEDPTSRVVRDWLDHVSTQLGQGSNRLLRRHLAPAKLPLTEVSSPSAEFSEASAVHLEYLQGIEFKRGQHCVHTVFERIRIQNSTGATQWSTFFINFNPEIEDVFVNELVVRDEQRSIVAKGELEDFFVKDDGDSGGTGKIAHLPVPGLAPGRDLEITYTRRSSGLEHFPFKRFDLPRRGPVERGVVLLSGGIGDVLHRVVGRVEVEESEDQLRFTAKGIVRGEREPFAVDSHRWQPTIWVSESTADWKKIGKDYLEQIQERLKPDEKLRPVAERVAGNLGTDGEKLRALSAYVRKEISYKSIAFGPRAYVPDPAIDVLNARFSDCKGHSILLYQLATALSVPCHLALISTDDDFWEEAMTRSQFNHMINYCPTVNGGKFIDCVDKGAPFGGIPNGLSDRTALVLDREESKLERLPDYSADENRLTIDRVVTCDSSGALTIEEHLTIEHNLSSYMRSFLQAREPNERPRAMQDVLRGIDPRIEVESVSAEALDDGERPLQLRLQLSLRGAMNQDGERWLGRAPALWEWEYLVPGAVQERLSPFRILMPYVIRTTLRVRGESVGIEVSDLGKSSTETKFCRWNREVVQTEDGVKLVCETQTIRGVHDAEHYGEFRAESVKAAEAAQLPFVAKRQ